jgi:hypothetical protein
VSNGKRKHKFNVGPKEKRTADNIVFDSAWEKDVYLYLKQHMPHDQFHVHPTFLLQETFRSADGKAQRAIFYEADFLLGPPRKDHREGLIATHEVIDCKGRITEVFKLKNKLFMYQYEKIIHQPRTGNLTMVYDIIQRYLKNTQQ